MKNCCPAACWRGPVWSEMFSSSSHFFSSRTCCLVGSSTASSRRMTVMGSITSRYLPRTKRSRSTLSAMFQMKLDMVASWLSCKVCSCPFFLDFYLGKFVTFLRGLLLHYALTRKILSLADDSITVPIPGTRDHRLRVTQASALAPLEPLLSRGLRFLARPVHRVLKLRRRLVLRH